MKTFYLIISFYVYNNLMGVPNTEYILHFQMKKLWIQVFSSGV